ncbi:MAG TPA: VCBS repeat-containing protein, partial [Kutzneria sp.]
IARSDLQVGDALWRNDSDTQHIALFVGWADAAHTQPIVMEEYDYGHFAEQRVWSADWANTFTPKRYKNIVGSASSGRPADLVRLEDNGSLTGWRNAGGFAGWAAPVAVGNAGTTDPARARFADLDGDGLADLVHVEDNGSLTAWHNNGFGSWAAPVTVGNAGTTDASRIQFADLDGDGRADLVRVEDSGSLTAWRSTGFGAWAAPAAIGNAGTTDATRVKFGDLDGDGRADLVHVEDNGALTAWRSTGFGSWAGPAAIGNAGTTDASRLYFANIG